MVQVRLSRPENESIALSDMQPTKPSLAPYASAMKKGKGRRRDIEGLREQFATDSAKPIPTEAGFPNEAAARAPA